MLTKELLVNFPKLRWLLKFFKDDKDGKRIDCFIAGGCFKDILQDKRVKDIDIFFPDEESFNSYTNTFNDPPLFETDKVKTFKVGNIKVECVRSTFGKIDQILTKFDFTIAMFGLTQTWDENGEIKPLCVFHQNFFQHLMQKQLVNEDGMSFLFPESSFNRMIRYSRYGYIPCRNTKIKLLNTIAKKGLVEPDMMPKVIYEAFD